MRHKRYYRRRKPSLLRQGWFYASFVLIVFVILLGVGVAQSKENGAPNSATTDGGSTQGISVVDKVASLWDKATILFTSSKDALQLATKGSISNQFNIEIKPARFVQRTPHPAGLLGSSSLDPSFQVSTPNGGLPITITVTPKESFSGEPFTERQVGGSLSVQSQPVWVLLYSQDNYLFGWNGPLTWSKTELQTKDVSEERNYNVIQAAKNRSPRTITFYVNGSDKDVVALQNATEQYLKGLPTAERYLYFNRISGDFGEWLGTTDSVAKINKDTASMTNQYFKVSVVGKDKIEDLMAQEHGDG